MVLLARGNTVSPPSSTSELRQWQDLMITQKQMSLLFCKAGNYMLEPTEGRASNKIFKDNLQIH